VQEFEEVALGIAQPGHPGLPDMAMSLQSEAYLATYLVYRDEADDERHRRWPDPPRASLCRA